MDHFPVETFTWIEPMDPSTRPGSAEAKGDPSSIGQQWPCRSLKCFTVQEEEPTRRRGGGGGGGGEGGATL